ncbi:MAG: hypothetical protein J6N93_06565 [Clostridia bacterium]|nr:hypothetical protein [Clostridia bacterium]
MDRVLIFLTVLAAIVALVAVVILIRDIADRNSEAEVKPTVIKLVLCLKGKVGGEEREVEVLSVEREETDSERRAAKKNRSCKSFKRRRRKNEERA